MKTALDTVLAYHQRTKHHLQRYAAGPGGLDWKNQPDPFRSFAGSPQLELPLLAASTHPLYADLYIPGKVAPQALTLNSIAALFELAFGLSAWKQYDGTRWALRCNPSSGNLHPTEAYLVSADCKGIADGVHHYVSRDHLLEQRCRFDTATGASEPILAPGAFLLGLSSIHWREAWKYGERAFRYCQHDAGHALAAVRYAAATLGWQVRVLSAWSDAEIGAMLGVDRDPDFGAAEHESPDAILLVTASARDSAAGEPDPAALVNAARRGQWQGRANVLAAHHSHQWPVIDEVAHASAKPETQQTAWQAPVLPEPASSTCDRTAMEIIRQRRSAQAFDGVSALPAEAFYRMLDMTLPRHAVPPWDAIAWAPRVHLLLFVHRVDDLAPGLYLFLRNEGIEAKLRAGLNPDFEWAGVQGCPAHFSLFRLVAADARNAARTLSCHQDIAADGAFSLAMLAEYDTSLAAGPWVYRQLFWEAGMLGQVLYLEAEAAGVRGTGIGCYFDDAVHDLLGIKAPFIQSMYHFTVGAALEDTRLQTLPAYAHLDRGVADKRA
ncbi:MAG TPA: SagB/ThcOx family dehydrogenase [Sulfuriferula sp.]|nr:SagB/ThcOx family dehydrogenase [Sulfuriferula sp.]